MYIVRVRRTSFVQVRISFVHVLRTFCTTAFCTTLCTQYNIKGLLVAVWFGFLGSCDGIETSRGTFSDLFKMFEQKKNFRFSTKNTRKSSF